MAERRSGDMAAKVAALRARIDDWRRNRKTRGPMPEHLWRQAARLARTGGVNPVAEALKLNYYDLKRRVVQGGANRTTAQMPVFVELAPPAAAFSGGCVVELARPDGAKMTIRMAGGRELVALADVFWSRGR